MPGSFLKKRSPSKSKDIIQEMPAGSPADSAAGAEASGSELPTAPPPPPPSSTAAEGSASSGDAARSAFGCSSDGTSVKLSNGDGTFFQLRTGPNYKKNGKKTFSLPHTYEPVSIDMFKRESICFSTAEHLALPPPPDGAAPNDSGLPRRLIINLVIPLDGPSLMRSPTEGPCYQIVSVYAASAATLKAWQDEGSSAAKLFARFCKQAPEGLVADKADVDKDGLDIKERIKIIPWIENAKAVGLPHWLEGYNGKPALITKSGSIHRGDDYLEITMNLYRFGFLTRKGMHHLLPQLGAFELHCAVTIEGREDDELDERSLLALKVSALDLVKLAKEGVLPEEGRPASARKSK